MNTYINTPVRANFLLIPLAMILLNGCSSGNDETLFSSRLIGTWQSLCTQADTSLLSTQASVYQYSTVEFGANAYEIKYSAFEDSDCVISLTSIPFVAINTNGVYVLSSESLLTPSGLAAYELTFNEEQVDPHFNMVGLSGASLYFSAQPPGLPMASSLSGELDISAPYSKLQSIE